MSLFNNRNIVEVPDNDTNHCKYCKERLKKYHIIESSKFFCNIDCLRGYLSFIHECDVRKNKSNDHLVNALYVIIGISLLLLIIRSF